MVQSMRKILFVITFALMICVVAEKVSANDGHHKLSHKKTAVTLLQNKSTGVDLIKNL